MTTEVETIGLALQTDGVERGIRSLDELAARGPKVERSMKGVETAATAAGKGVSSLGASNAKGLDDVARAGERAAQGLRSTGEAARSAVSSQQALASAVAQFTNAERSYVQSLVDEYKQLSMGRAERAAYIAQTKGMSSAAQEVARAVGQKIEAHRKEQEEAKKAVAAAESLGRAWNAVGNVIGGVAVAMAGNFSYRTFIRETIQAEQEQTQLQAVLRSTGESAGWSAQRLNDMADAMSSRNGKSIFSSGEITQAQTRLLSYTGIVGEQLPRAMQNVIDMSSRMGMDLKSSAETIGRALGIPSEGLTALQRQGFRFTEAQKIMVKQLEDTGRVGEAQAIVLQALESSYGGAAVAARDTFGGSLAALRSSVNDLMTGSGGNMTDMKSGIESLNEALASDQTRAAFQTFVGWMGQVSAVSVKGAANLMAFLGATDKLAIIAGTDAYGQLKSSAEGYSRQLEQLTGRAERFQEAINRGDNVTQNQRNLEKTRAKIAEVQSQSMAASDALKQFAGGISGTGAAVASVTPQIDAQGAALGKTAEFVMKYGTASEKAAAAVAKARKEYGASFTPEMQKQIEAFYAKQDKGAIAAAAALKTEQGAYQSLVASIKTRIEQGAAEEAAFGKLTESQKLGIKLTEDLSSGRLKLTATHEAYVRSLTNELAAQEQANKAKELQARLDAERISLNEELAAAFVAESNARQRGALAVYEYEKGIRDANDALKYELSLMGLSEQAREVALEQYRIELELKKQIAAIDDNGAYDEPQREELRAKARAAAAIAKANASSKVFLDNWKESVKQYDDIFRQGFADMLNRGEDGWKSFTRSLVTTFKTSVADAIYKMFAQPFVVKIVGQMMGLTGGGGGTGAAGGGGVMGAVQSASNINSLFGAGSQALFGASAGASMASLGYANAVGMIGGDAIGALAAANGMWAGVATGAQAAAQAAVAANAAAAAGTATALPAGTLAAAAGAPPAAGGIAGALGAIPGWGWALAGVGALFGGDIISGLFGRKLKDQGIEGTFGGESDFEGRTYQYYKGGLFRSNKTKYGELDEDLRSGLADQFGALQAGTSEMAKILGLGTSAIDDFTAGIKVSFSGLDEAGIQEALKAEFQKIAESMASMTLGTTEFSRAGETSVEAITRLAGSLSAVNQVMDTLGLTLLNASLAGGSAASSLVDAFGGIESFVSATGSFYENYYSEAERMETLSSQLSKTLAGFDLSIDPRLGEAAKEQFRAAATAALDAGDGKLAASLLAISGNFATAADYFEQLSQSAAEAAKKAAEEARKAVIDAMSAAAAGYYAVVDRNAAEAGYVDDAQAAIDKMFGSVSAQAQAAAQAQASAAQAAAASWRSAASSIQSSLDKLRADTTADMDPAARLALTRAQLGAYTSAALGGDADAASKMASAADAFLQASDVGSITRADYLRDRITAEAQLASVLESSQAKASVQESIAAAANASVSELQALNANLTGFAGSLYELLSKGYQGADRGAAQTVAQSFAKMQADYDAYFKDTAGFGAVGHKYTDASFNGASFTKLDGNMAAFTGADGLVSYLRAGESLVEIAKRVPELRKLWEQNYGIKLPAFAEGGYHAGGLRVVGERGWEIEATGPARIWNQQQIASAMRGGDNGSAQVVQALQTVSTQIARLEARLAAIEDSNDQMAAQQDNSTDGGNAQRAEIMNVKQLAQAIKEAMA